MRKKINESVIHGEAWVSAVEKVYQYGPAAAAFFGMTGVGAFFASGWADLAAHGWGAVGLAGLGVGCATMLTLSVAAFAWRYLKPLPRRSDTSVLIEKIASPTIEFGRVESKIEVLDAGENLGGQRQYFRLWIPIRFKRRVSDVAIRVSALRPLGELDQSAPQYVWKPFESRSFHEGDILEVVFATMPRDRGYNGFYGEDLRSDTCRIGGVSQHLFEIDVLIGSERTTKRIYLETLHHDVLSGAPRNLGRFGNLFCLAEQDHTPFDSEWVTVSRDAVAGRITLPLGAARPRGGFGLLG